MTSGPRFSPFIAAAVTAAGILLTGCAERETVVANTGGPVQQLPPLAGAPPAASNARKIAEVVSRMQNAIFQRDVVAYMACCTPADQATITERRYFVNDFYKNPVFRVRLSVGDLVARNGNVVEGTLRWVWSYRVNRKDVQREYTGYARFIRTPEGWLYDGPLWERLKDRDVQVWYIAGFEPAAKAALAAFHEVKYSVQATVNAQPTPPQIIKLYPSSADLKFGISLSYNEEIDGWNEPGESIRLVSSKDRPESEFRGLIAHEYGHVCTFALGPTANDMPWWALEGIAELSAEPFQKDGVEHLRSLREESAKGTLVPMADLADMDTIRPENFGKVYTQGRGVVRFVLTAFGDAKRDAWLRAMANGTAFDEACRTVLAVSAEELERRWRDSLR